MLNNNESFNIDELYKYIRIGYSNMVLKKESFNWSDDFHIKNICYNISARIEARKDFRYLLVIQRRGKDSNAMDLNMELILEGREYRENIQFDNFNIVLPGFLNFKREEKLTIKRKRIRQVHAPRKKLNFITGVDRIQNVNRITFELNENSGMGLVSGDDKNEWSDFNQWEVVHFNPALKEWASESNRNELDSYITFYEKMAGYLRDPIHKGWQYPFYSELDECKDNPSIDENPSRIVKERMEIIRLVCAMADSFSEIGRKATSQEAGNTWFDINKYKALLVIRHDKNGLIATDEHEYQLPFAYDLRFYRKQNQQYITVRPTDFLVNGEFYENFKEKLLDEQTLEKLRKELGLQDNEEGLNELRSGIQKGLIAIFRIERFKEEGSGRMIDTNAILMNTGSRKLLFFTIVIDFEKDVNIHVRESSFWDRLISPAITIRDMICCRKPVVGKVNKIFYDKRSALKGKSLQNQQFEKHVKNILLQYAVWFQYIQKQEQKRERKQ